MVGLKIDELRSRVVATTPTDHAHFFGFYDICPWSYDGGSIVLLRTDSRIARTPVGERATVCIWNPASGEVAPVAETTGWNFQHGARTQWLRNGNILFNDVDAERQCARIVQPDGKLVCSLESSVGALHPDETYGVTANYARLASLYSAYGYHVCKNPHIDASADGDGLWRVDLDAGKASLLLSYRRICEFVKARFSPKMFVTHPAFSPSGDRLLFGLAEERELGSHFIWLVVYDVKDDRLHLVNADKNSHPAWIGDSKIMVWARCSAAVSFIRNSGILSIPGVGTALRLIRKWQGPSRGVAFSEGFHIFEIDEANRSTLIPPTIISEDGHPSKHPDRDVMLCDTYPDETGYLTLFLYSLATRERLDVARFHHGVLTTNPDLRCDLHPRWNRTGQQVSVDFSDNGVRRMAVVDVTQGLDSLASQSA